VHQRTELGVQGADAIVDDHVRADGRDVVLHLDVEVVDSKVETRNKARRPHAANGVGVGGFRTQVRIATGLTVVLLGRIGLDGQNLGRRQVEHGGAAHDQRIGRRLAAAQQSAGIHRAVEHDVLRREQFDHVRGADRAVVAGAQAQAIDDRPVTGGLVGVGGPGVRVVGEAVGQFGGDVLGPGLVLHEWDARFAVEFVDVVAAVHRGLGRAVAVHVAGSLGEIRPGVEVLAAVLGAEADADLVVGHRALDALGQRANDVKVRHLLDDVAGREGRRLQILQGRRGDPAQGEVIDGHAVRVAAVDHRLADDLAGGVAPRDQRPVDPRGDEVAVLLLRQRRLPVLQEGVVAPVAADLALQADDVALLLVVEDGQAATAFDGRP
jgi:hypothetical protein